jgi:hypothetical protein
METLKSAGCPPKRHHRCCPHSGRRLPVRRRVRRHPASHRAFPLGHPCHQTHRRPKNRRPGSRPSRLVSRLPRIRLLENRPSNPVNRRLRIHRLGHPPSNPVNRHLGNHRPSNLANRHLANHRPSSLANRHLMHRRRKAWTASRASTTRKHRHHHHRLIHRTIGRRWSHPSCHRTACWNCCRRWNRKSLKNPRSRTNQMTPTNRRRACSVTTACWRKKTVLRSRPSGKRRRCRWQSPALQSRAGGRLQGFCSSHSPEGNQELSDARAGPSPRPGLACDGRAERALSFNMCRFTVPPGSAWARRRGHRLHRSGRIEADRPGDRRPCSARER